MRKIIVIIVMSLFLNSMSSFAQTYEDIKSVNAHELEKLNSQLEKVNDRIYYLDVTLTSDPAQVNKKGIIYNNAKKKRDLYFKDEELKQLNTKKAKLLTDIDRIESSSVAIDDQRMAKKTSDLPEKMGPVDFKQRSRSQAFQSLENNGAIMDAKNQLKGKLINQLKVNGQTAYFYFTRTDIDERITRPGIPVEPLQEKTVYLPMGVYHCVVMCGSFSKELMVHVDPRLTVEIGKDNETVHFWVVKERYAY